MQFKIEGRTYEFDESRLTVAEARVIKKHAGLGLAEFGDGIRRGDPDAIVSMLFIAKRRAGEAVRWQDFDEFNLADIDMGDEAAAEGDEEDTSDAEQAEPDPTPPSAPDEPSTAA